MLLKTESFSLSISKLSNCKKLKQQLLFTLFTLTFSTGNVYSQSQEDVDFAPRQQELQWTPGEQYNAVNGTMNYSHTDLYLPGNGKLPIEITRRFIQRPYLPSTSDQTNPTGQFGHFTLNVPYLYYGVAQNTPSGEIRYCEHDGGFNLRSIVSRPLVFKLGDTTKVFYPSSQSPESLVITQDGWKAECLAHKQSIGYDNQLRIAGTILVSRPDGVQYELWVRSHGISAGSGVPSWTTNFAIRQISDPYGNTLTYSYDENITYSFSRINAITANDGRAVTFKYLSNDVEVHASTIYGGRGSNYDYNVISTIESNSRTDPFSIRYEYQNDYTQIKATTNGQQTNTVTTSNGRIDSIAYPTGGVVNYEYSGNTMLTAGTRYTTLKSRKTSDNATYDFDHTDNGDDTFTRQVKTPSALLEYKYGNPVRATSAGVVRNHKLNSGRMISFSRYGLNSSNNKGEKLFSVAFEYINLSDDSVTNQVHQLVKTKKTTTSMNFDSGGTPASVFVTRNTLFDSWGYPTSTQEIDSAGRSFWSSYSYYSPESFTSPMVGKIRNSRRTIDYLGGVAYNSQGFTYNSQGDVTSHTINGDKTDYTWHTSGNSKGELHTEKTALGHTTYYTDYKRGQAQQVKDPSDYSQYSYINDNGTLGSQSRFTKRGADSDRTRFSYDSVRRLDHVAPERSASLATRHNWLSNTLRITQDENNTRYYGVERYDEFGRISVEYQLDRDQSRWSTVVHKYDSEGRLRSSSYPANIAYPGGSIPSLLPGIHYTYDALDRITQVRHDEENGNDSVVSYVYGADSSGQLTIRETDARASVKTTTYSAYGSPHYQWPVRIVEADGEVTTIDRDGPMGHIVKYTRGAKTTTYAYHYPSYRLASIDQSENGLTSFDYDDDGRLETRFNNDRGVTYSYFNNGQIRQEYFTDPARENVTRTYTYDDYQNMDQAVSSSASESQYNQMNYSYDEDNNVTSSTLLMDGQLMELRYLYDELSNLSGVIYPNKRRYSLNPNSLGSPTAIQEIGGTEKKIYEQIQYNPNHSMKQMLRSAHLITNELSLGQKPARLKASRNTGNFNALGERRYRYDKAANVSQIDDTVNGRYMVFSYDNRNRLIEENINNADNWSYSYLRNDDINWIQKGSEQSTYSYDANTRRLRSVRTGNQERVFEYDAQGNITAHERLQGDSKVTRLLTYNAANQLVAMNDGTSYAYDTRGLRVKQDRNGAIYTLYGPDEKLMYRFDRQTEVTSEYFYVDGKLVARRDTDISQGAPDTPDTPDAPDTPDTPDENDGSGIKVSGLTISWPDDGWYQVQSENGSTTYCSGGRSCTVPSSGTYLVINHSEQVKSRVVVNPNTPDTPDENNGSGIKVSGLTIGWPDDGWYQVQSENGSTTYCSGGRSCIVPSSGTYLVINHSEQIKSRVVVN